MTAGMEQPDLTRLVAARFEQSISVPEAFFETAAERIAEACWAGDARLGFQPSGAARAVRGRGTGGPPRRRRRAVRERPRLRFPLRRAEADAGAQRRKSRRHARLPAVDSRQRNTELGNRVTG